MPATANTSSETNGFRLWIDGDACPKKVRELVLDTVFRRRIHVVFVANRYMMLPPSELVSMRMVPEGLDKADDHIVDEAAPRDIAVTADIPLAARLVEKGVTVLNPRGEEYTTANIGERLATRHLMDELRSSGMITGGPKEFGAMDIRRFADALDRTLTRRLKDT